MNSKNPIIPPKNGKLTSLVTDRTVPPALTMADDFSNRVDSLQQNIALPGVPLIQERGKINENYRWHYHTKDEDEKITETVL